MTGHKRSVALEIATFQEACGVPAMKINCLRGGRGWECTNHINVQVVQCAAQVSSWLHELRQIRKSKIELCLGSCPHRCSLHRPDASTACLERSWKTSQDGRPPIAAHRSFAKATQELANAPQPQQSAADVDRSSNTPQPHQVAPGAARMEQELWSSPTRSRRYQCTSAAPHNSRNAHMGARQQQKTPTQCSR